MVGVACAVAGAACKDDQADARKAADRECAEERTQSQEAMEWLARDDTMGFELTKSEMRELAQQLYDAGARTVEVGYSALGDEDSGDTVEIGGLLVVVLPAAKPARQAVLAEAHRIDRLFYEDARPRRDLGQSCLLVALD